MSPLFLELKARFFPKNFFARALIILSAPLLLVQVVSNFVFLDRHLDSVTHLLSENIVGMVKTLAYLEEEVGKGAEAAKIATTMYHMEYSYLPGVTTLKQMPLPTSWAESYLIDELNAHLGFPYTLIYDDQHLIISVQTKKGVMVVKFLRKRLMSKTTQLVFIWAIGTSILSLLIAALFMRNQVKPLRTLSEKTEALGKGGDVPDLRPRGSTEIRQVTLAFNVMKNRIKRQLKQRAEMLAGISHDLRTPLTRMKLALEMLPPSPALKDLQADVHEMQHMVDDYLAFIRNDDQEKVVKTNLKEMLEEIASRTHAEHQIELTINTEPDPLLVALRPRAMRRVIENLLNNAVRHATVVEITASADGEELTLLIDDNGPGIPFEKRQDVFKAFYRIDASRSKETGGIGLGLSIVQDIIHRHGGEIFLEDAPLGGLRVLITLPT